MATKAQYQVAVVNELNLANTGVTFAATATNSSIINCGGTTPVGIILPATWTGCNISFNVAKVVGGTFVPLTNFDGSAFSIGANSGSVCIPLNPQMFCGILCVQLVCSIAQAAATSVDFNLAPIFQGIHN